MTRKRAIMLLLAVFVGLPAAVAVVIACMPSVMPPQCPKTSYLGKTAGSTVVLPPGGGAFTTLIGLLPFVSWDAGTAACAMPSASEVTLELDCTPVGGGAPFTLGPVTFPLGAPGGPGAQPVAGGGVAFPIPAGTPPSTCLVTGTYDVDFTGGVGAMRLSAAGDLEICLVEPSPIDPILPRLDLQILDVGLMEGPAQFAAHQGDQGQLFVLVANNSDETAQVSLESEGKQIAVFPMGFTSEADAYASGVYRISDPNGDVFPTAIITDDGPLPTDRVPGVPGDRGTRPLTMTHELEPGEVDVFALNTNSFGACADGSCSERNLCVRGQFANGGPPHVAKACTQYTHRVDNSRRPRYPGLTIDVETKAHPQVDAQWTNTSFLDGKGNTIDQTHEGNLLPNFRIQPNSILQTTGDLLRAGLPPNLQWPGRVETRITLPQQADAATFETYVFDQRDGFVGQYNLWEVGGLQGQTADCNLPAFSLAPGTAPQQGGFRRSFIDFKSDGRCGPNSEVVIHEEVGGAREEIFNGTFGDLVQESLRNSLLKLDLLTCRTLTFPHGNLLEADLLVPDPPFVVENAPFDAATLQRTIAFFDRNGNPAPFQSARIEGAPGATVGTPNGTGNLGLTFDLSGLDQALETFIATLLVESPTALNATAANPLEIPIVIRREQSPVLPMLMPELDGPGLIQAGERYPLGITLDPEIAALIQDLECLLGLDNPDEVDILALPDNPFSFDPFDETTPQGVRDRVGGLFGEVFDTEPCFENEQSCFLLSVDPGIADMEIFTDGFESGDVSAWSYTCKGSNTESTSQKNRVLLVEKPFGVLDENNVLPVETEDELFTGINLFNEDVIFDTKTIGLASDRFTIDVPLPPIRGTYFFDEFESFRKSGRSNHPVLDGSRCPAPCSGLVFEAPDGGVSNLRFEDFPSHGIDIRNDSLWIASNEFAGNAGGGLLISGNNNFVADSLVRANVFEDNGGPAITVLRGTGNRLTYNTFASGGSLPIDLGNDGRTENDDGDRDTGPNDLQNFPVLTNVMTGSTVVQGTLNSTPSSSFTLQFYAGDDVLLRFLGEAEVRTDADGNAAFDLSLDETAEVGERVYATATNADGSTSEFSRPFAVVGVAAEDGPVLPTHFALFQNYPNPFNPATTIRYDVPRAGAVRLEVIDLAGRQVALLVDNVLPAGRHTVNFGARNLPSGVYLYRLSGEGFETTKKLLLLK